MEKKSQNSILLNDFLIWIKNQRVNFKFAFLQLNSDEGLGNFAQKIVQRGRGRRALHREGRDRDNSEVIAI